MGTIKGMIFDLDGTLLDTISDIAQAMNVALKEFDFVTHSVNEYKSMIGNGAAILTRRATGFCDDVLFEKVFNKYKQQYKENIDVYTEPFEGIIDTLKIIQKEYKIAVLSNKPDADVKALAKNYFSEIMFVTVQGQISGTPIKPDPTLALEISNEMRLSTNEIAFIGDSPEDIKTAKNANMIPVGVSWGYRSKKQLQDAGAIKICDKTGDLLNWKIN